MMPISVKFLKVPQPSFKQEEVPLFKIKVIFYSHVLSADGLRSDHKNAEALQNATLSKRSQISSWNGPVPVTLQGSIACLDKRRSALKMGRNGARGP